MTEISPSPLDRILELKDELEKQKVPLSTYVKKYIQKHLDMVQEKLGKKEDVKEDDMKFIDEVKMWVGLPEKWRDKYPSIQLMNKSEKVRETIAAVHEKKISIQQWLDLLHVAKSMDKPKEWIDHQFKFPGKMQIKVLGHFIPTGSLTHLPDHLEVSGDLSLDGCAFITYLGEYLKVGGSLQIHDCSTLVQLPEHIEVGQNLGLTHDLQSRVHEDVERLKKEGKIKGEIKYY